MSNSERNIRNKEREREDEVKDNQISSLNNWIYGRAMYCGESVCRDSVRKDAESEISVKHSTERERGGSCVRR